MKVILLEWTDASGTEKYYIGIATPKDQDIGLQTNTSVGLLITETEKFVALAQSYSESGWYRDIISIPTVNITKREELK